jgi:hypothetical protein
MFVILCFRVNYDSLDGCCVVTERERALREGKVDSTVSTRKIDDHSPDLISKRYNQTQVTVH